ncbi:MAG: hypothetical protein LKJ90_07085 [Faecalibacterium sp.]|jgi:hypothetical protein|nr:hypothetical protein [Faecalibacterium sp.]
MTTENLKNWIKLQDAEFAGILQLGGVDANAEKYLGIYPAGQAGGNAQICLGGLACTTTETLRARLLLRWGQAIPAAEAKARKLWNYFAGLSDADMDGAHVYLADPGASPVFIGKDSCGVVEYVINLEIICERE